MFRAVIRLLALTLLVAACRRAPEKPQLTFSEVWSRPVQVTNPAEGANGVVYLNIANHGGADRLLRAHAEVCEVTEIHQTLMHGDRMSMQPVSAEGLEVPAQGKLKLAPRGNHIMLMQLKQSLRLGDSIEVHLDFAESGMKTVYSKIRE